MSDKELVDLLNQEIETLQVGAMPPKRSMAPTEQEIVVSGSNLPESQFLQCRATKGCSGRDAVKVQDIHISQGRLLRFQCCTCHRSWALTI